MSKYRKLEEENKKLKKELELVRKNVRANVETLDLMYGENLDLKKENEELLKENAKLENENISLHIEIEEIKDCGNLSYEERLYGNN